MIIFGTRGVTTTPDQGEFYCPQCGPTSPFKHRRVRRFFTLYFIPVIPLDQLGEYVECSRCLGTYELGVLEFNPAGEDAAFEAEFHRAIGRVMVLMMLADGDVDPAEVQTIRDVYGKLAGTPITEEDVLIDVEQAKSSGLGVHDYLAGMIGQLNERGKEQVVTAAFMVAAADGKFDEEEVKLLDTVSQALEMSRAHYQGLMAELHAGTGAPKA